MTEQEQKAIKWMKNVRDDAVVTLDHIAKEEPNVSPMLYAGRKEKAETIIKGFEELEQYRAIGTPEECRAAVEKQKAKKIVRVKLRQSEWGSEYRCPVCESDLIKTVFFNEDGTEPDEKISWCSGCGQKLDWGDEE